MKYREYRKRDPQWTDALLRNVRFEAGDAIVRAQDREGSPSIPIAMTRTSCAEIWQVLATRLNTIARGRRSALMLS